ncbi:MAG: protein translocase subunit SecD [Candidatus Methylomirabilia bacterium]
MRRKLWLRIGIVLAVVLGSVWLLYPPRQTINLGLDLQGGIHLVLGVEVDKAVEARVERTVTDLRSSLDGRGIAVSQLARQELDEIAIQLASPQAWNDALTALSEFQAFEQRSADQGDGRITLALRAREGATIRDFAVRQALETIRNRVDQFGVAEPAIQRQGENRILIQLPGVQDPERAKALIGKTALLEFKWLDESADVARALREGPPAGSEVVYERRVDKQTGQEQRVPFVVRKKTLLTGADLATARMTLDQSTGEPFVSVEFNKVGAKAFAELTERNVGRRLAIILDGSLHSAPVIRERIPLGRAQITGGFTVEEATDLAIVLRAGALPAPVKILEERRVGPSLGADSIRRGIVSILAGAAAVLLFMLIYYRLSGLVADVALGLNLLVLLGTMAAFNATLTLPGLAGIVLTIGIAVDTNILIFERIREELRSGKTVRAAIDSGFARAFRTVLDTHVTVLVSALVLYIFGTGPVKGFAVTLAIGILASLFTAVFFTRLVFNLMYMGHRRLPSLSI